MIYNIAAFDTGAKLFRGVAQKDAFVQSYLEKMNKADIDLIVFPASLVPAPKQVSTICFFVDAIVHLLHY